MEHFAHLSRRQMAAANYHYARHSFAHFLNSMAELDIHKIEFYAGAPHLSVEDASESDVTQIGRELAARGIEVCCFTQEQGGAMPINIATEDASVRRRSLRAFERSMEFAAILGAPKVLVMPGRSSYDIPEEEAWKWSVQSLGALAEKARAMGLTLVVESSSYHNTNVGYSVARVRGLLDEVASPALKGMLDTCSVAKAGEDFGESFRLLGEDMCHVHFADGNPMGHLVPGDGNLPLTEYLQVLDEMEYREDIAFEIYNWQYDFEPHRHMQRAWDYLQSRLG